MATAGSSDESYSQAEIAVAIRALGMNDLLRLRAIARSLSLFAPIEAEDLVQEAVCRTMEGTRVCPRAMALVPFLAGVMSSLASDTVKARRRHPQQSLAGMMDKGLYWPDSSPLVEEELIQAEDLAALNQRASTTKRRVLDLFPEDLVAQTLAEGIMIGLEGEELRQLTELDKKAFDSKRRLIRRRISKAFGTSEKS